MTKGPVSKNNPQDDRSSVNMTVTMKRIVLFVVFILCFGYVLICCLSCMVIVPFVVFRHRCPKLRSSGIPFVRPPPPAYDVNDMISRNKRHETLFFGNDMI
jgi:hypothetical protein